MTTNTCHDCPFRSMQRLPHIYIYIYRERERAKITYIILSILISISVPCLGITAWLPYAWCIQQHSNTNIQAVYDYINRSVLWYIKLSLLKLQYIKYYRSDIKQFVLVQICSVYEEAFCWWCPDEVFRILGSPSAVWLWCVSDDSPSENLERNVNTE